MATNTWVKTVVEVGAGEGHFIRYARNRYLALQRMLCVEALPALATDLSKRSPKHVTVINAACGDAEGRARPRGSTRFVAVRTLDGLVSEWQPEGFVDVLKIDTQGSELAVLRGATETLKRTHVVMVNSPAPPCEVSACLEAAGFKFSSLESIEGASLVGSDAVYVRG